MYQSWLLRFRYGISNGCEGQDPSSGQCNCSNYPVDAYAGAVITVNCTIPTGETIASLMWDNSVHVWRQTLTPSNGSWNGRQIRETDFDAAADGCWFDGSTRTPVSGVSSTAPLTLGPNGIYNDRVGYGTGDVSYYRVERPARSLPMPCAYVVNQSMQMLCPPSNWSTFAQNVLVGRIGLTTVESERSPIGGPVNKVSRTYP